MRVTYNKRLVVLRHSRDGLIAILLHQSVLVDSGGRVILVRLK